MNYDIKFLWSNLTYYVTDHMIKYVIIKLMTLQKSTFL